MRKHFLILMLLTLLPLAGWAQGAGTGDIRQATVYIEPFGYGGFDLDDVTPENPATITPATGLNIRITDGSGVLREGEEYTVSSVFYNVNDQDVVGEQSEYTNYTLLPVGKYAVKITGINTYNNGYSVYGIFEVKKPILKITFEDGEGNAWGDIVKLYGTSDKQPYQIENLTIKATVKNSAYTYNNGTADVEVPAKVVELTTAQKEAIAYTKDNNNENANATPAGVYFNATQESDGTGRALAWSGLSTEGAANANIANYTIEYPKNVYLKIKQETILAPVTEGNGFYLSANAFTNSDYDATNKVPSFTVTFKNGGLFKTTADNLTTGEQYTVSYTYCEVANGTYYPVTTPKDAGFYKVFVNGLTQGNYYGTVQYGSFNIAKAALTIMPLPQSKVYGETPALDLTTAKWSISGRMGDDQSKTIEGLRAYGVIGTTVKAYPVTPQYKGSIIEFTSYPSADDVTAYASGTAELLSKDDNSAIIKVVTNTTDNQDVVNAADFIGQIFKITIPENFQNRVQLYNGENFETETGIWVKLPNELVVEDLVSAATIGTGNDKVELAKNYNIETMAVNWNITARPLVISVDDQVMVKGAAQFPDLADETVELSEFDATTKTGALEADVENLTKAFKVVYDNTEGGVLWVAATATTGAHAMTANEVEIPGYDDAIIAKKVVYTVTGPTENKYYVSGSETPYDTQEAAQAAATQLNNEIEALLANYSFDITTAKAKLIVNGKAFTVIPVVQNTFEYGDKIELGYYAYDNTDHSQVTTVPASAVKYKIKKGTEYVYDESSNVPEMLILPTERGVYTVEIIENKEGMAVGPRQGADVTILTGSFSIIQKTIKPTVGNLTLHIGDNISKIQLAGAIYEDDTKKPFGEEKPVFTFGLVENKIDKNNANKITGWHDGVNPDANGTVASIITLELTNDAVNSNYVIDAEYIKGDVTLLDTYKLDLAPTETVIAEIQDAEANGNEYNVTLTDANFVLKKDQWSTLVLPFAIDPLQFCKEVGTYAVFNYLKSAENGNVKFALTYNELPANTPFLVKPQKDIDFGKMDDNGTPTDLTDDTRAIIFHGVKLNTERIDANAKTATVTVDDANFIGVYKQATVDGAEGIFIPQNGKFHELPTGNTHQVYFMAAYLNVNSTSPARITVEEADGSTTAISAITADGKLIPAEGWYTLNGMKLNSVPTEKGVYIQNGKKVVIK